MYMEYPLSWFMGIIYNKKNTTFAIIGIMAILRIMGPTISTGILLQKAGKAACQAFYDSSNGLEEKQIEEDVFKRVLPI